MMMIKDLTSRWSEPAAGAKFSFEMIKTVPVEAKLGDAAGRSSCSR
jgi:hypothetical protein